MEKIIIGLAGEIASGKGTVSKYIIEKYQGSSHRFSTMLRDVLGRLYMEESRDNMSRLSTVLRENFGEDLLAKVMFHDAQRDKNAIVVIDGVRRKEDIKYLENLLHFKLVYVEADMKVRYDRITNRGENSDDKQKTFAEFEKDHQLETELRIRDLKVDADYVLDNNGRVEDLYAQVDAIFSNPA